MKKLFLFAYCLLPAVYAFSQGVWTQKADYPGFPRNHAVGFSIGNYGYVGAGYRYFNNTYYYYNDYWKYDPILNSWGQIANFPSATNSVSTASFTIGNAAYLVGEGATPTSDVWKYNPILNSWSKVANIPQVLIGAVGFAIGNYGYITVGADTVISWVSYNLWQYNASLNSWTQKANFPGLGRTSAVSFSIGNNGYVGTGYNENGQYVSDFWKYAAINNSWISVANFGGGGRGGAIAFVIDSFGYVGTGWQFPGSGSQQDIWRYDTTLNTWIQEINFSGFKRYYAASFSIGKKGYVAIGIDGIISNNTDTFFHDLWEFTPGPAAIKEHKNDVEVSIYPNPFSEETKLQVTSYKLQVEKMQMQVFDLLGNELYPPIIHNSNGFVIRRGNLLPGIYIYAMKSTGNKTLASGKIIIINN